MPLNRKMDNLSASGPRHDTPISDATSEIGRPTLIEIAKNGDVVLELEHGADTGETIHSFRVSSSALTSVSGYFRNLFLRGRFNEAAEIEAKHVSLHERYSDFIDVPIEDLPVVRIRDLGRISAVKVVDALMTDFLYILHRKDVSSSLPVANLANLAVVADRFDALDAVKAYMQRKKAFQSIDGRTSGKADIGLNEEKVRQRLLAGILFDHDPWVERYSARLITRGWVGNDMNTSAALWWDLPQRVEEELLYRRDSVLDTIQALQTHFLQLYTSRERQCKLGYDSSAQCDSFQLGEMVRFFYRVDMLRFQGTLLEHDRSAVAFSGDLFSLLETMRQVPEYQIDKFHAHCGIRTKVIPLLDAIQSALLHVGICSRCCKANRPQYAWMEARQPLLWSRQNLHLNSHDHKARHEDLRALFTAADRDWNG